MSPSDRAQLFVRCRAAAFTALQLTILACADVSHALGQHVVRQLAVGDCPQCRLVVSHSISLAAPAGVDSLPDGIYFVRPCPSGSYCVIRDGAPERFSIYGENGKFVKSVTLPLSPARKNGGLVTTTLLPGDSIIAWDWRQQACHIFGPDLQLTRTQPLPFAPSNQVVPLRSGAFVQNLELATADEIGLPLHLIERNGKKVRSFGSESGIFRGDIPGITLRRLASAGPEEVWSAWTTQYVIERWSSAGQLREVLRRQVAWFPAYDRGNPNVVQPLLNDIWADGDGILYVAINVPSKANTPRNIGAPSRATTWNESYDTLLEAVDVTTGRILAATRLASPLVNFISNGEAVVLRPVAGGAVELDIVKIQLIGHKPNRRSQ